MHNLLYGSTSPVREATVQNPPWRRVGVRSGACPKFDSGLATLGYRLNARRRVSNVGLQPRDQFVQRELAHVDRRADELKGDPFEAARRGESADRERAVH